MSKELIEAIQNESGVGTMHDATITNGVPMSNNANITLIKARLNEVLERLTVAEQQPESEQRQDLEDAYGVLFNIIQGTKWGDAVQWDDTIDDIWGCCFYLALTPQDALERCCLEDWICRLDVAQDYLRELMDQCHDDEDEEEDEEEECPQD